MYYCTSRGGGPKHIFGNFTIMLVEEILFFPGRGPPNYPLDPRMCVYIYRGLRFILSNRALVHELADLFNEQITKEQSTQV